MFPHKSACSNPNKAAMRPSFQAAAAATCAGCRKPYCAFSSWRRTGIETEYRQIRFNSGRYRLFAVAQQALADEWEELRQAA